MAYATDEIVANLRAARERTALSQRDLSARIGVPQSHISKIENGSTDLRLSSLIELARALDHEVVLVPRRLLPAIEAIVSNASSSLSADTRQQSVTLNRAQAVFARLARSLPDRPELRRLEQTLRELANFRLSNSDLGTIREITDKIRKRPSRSSALPAALRATQQLQNLRNRIAHAVPDAPRPAYALDEGADDA
jgi:transcriptional regulator with XRE-family HTH domain